MNPRGALLAMLSAFLPLVAAPEPARGEAAELVVMTYNLRYASPLPPNSWPERRPMVVELWKRHAPDVVGTQEGVYRQLLDLAADLPEYGWIGLGREGGSRGEFTAVFFRKDRLEPTAFDHFWLSDTPRAIASKSWGNSVLRMTTWVRFRDRSSGKEFVFFNTHLDHQSQPSREKSARLILEQVKKVEGKLPVLLVGDFNAAAGKNPVYDVLVGPDRFTDAWVGSPHEGRQVATFNGFRYPAAAEGERIDWILLRGGPTALRTTVDAASKGKQYPSDHFPVIARVRMP